MATVVRFVFNLFQENTYLLIDEPSGKCVVVDPGCSNSAEEQALLSYIRERDLQPVLLLNTHAHIDHILGNACIGKAFGLPLRLHEKDVPLLEAAPRIAVHYGLPSPEFYPVFPEHYLRDGERISFGESRLEVIYTPGHAPGEVCFYLEEDKVLIAGDVLFRESIGRTDLPGGDQAVLLQSIKDRLWPLPDDTRVLPGHGPETSIGYEKLHNPYVGLNAGLV